MTALRDIIDPVIEPVAIHGNIDDVEISDLVMRSDSATAGSLFFCVPGSTRDGHDFAPRAIEHGAAALVVSRQLALPADVAQVPQVEVADVRSVIGPIADSFHGFPSRELEVFGVTGTNGKTTTSHLVHAMLAAAGRAPGLIGTVGARVGDTVREVGFTTPEALDLQRLFRDMLDAGNRSCSMEVSSHALDQGRAASTRFAAVGFTNLTRDHLDYHRGFEAYYLAKRRLFDQPGPEGQHFPAAINCDDEWGGRLFDELVHSPRNDVPVWGFTLNGMARASVSARYRLTDSGAVIEVEAPVGDFELTSRLRGRFNVENVLCAATMCLLTGVTPEQVQAGLDRIDGVRGRFEPVDCGQNFSVFVDYAHTPDSLEQVLASARDLADGRVIVVFGCGGDRDRSKRPLMGRVAAAGADLVVVTSDNPRTEDPAQIIAEIRKGIRGTAGEVVEPDRRQAIAHAIGLAEPGDVVVIAGKGHEQGQVFADEVLPFDDATVAREALESLVVT